jgi:hypothetical protein
MKSFKMTLLSIIFSGSAGLVNAQVNFVSDLVDSGRPVLNGVLTPLTAPLSSNDAFQQGYLQLASGISPLINDLVVQGGGIASELVNGVSALDNLTLPGLEMDSADAAVLDLGTVILEQNSLGLIRAVPDQ